MIVLVCDQGESVYKRDIHKCTEEVGKYLLRNETDLKEFIEHLLIQRYPPNTNLPPTGIARPWQP